MTISDLIQAVAAVATLAMSYMTYRSLRLMMRERKRPVVREIIQKVVMPFVSQLDEELHAIKTHEYGWSHRAKRAKKLSKFPRLRS